MDVVRDEAVLNLNLNNERVLARQLQATRDRFEVGEVTRTDVAQAESRLSSAKAETIQADGALVRSRARYRQIIGDAPGTLKAPPLLGDLPLSENDAINRARDSSPDVIAARFDEQSARLSIKSSKRNSIQRSILSASLTGAIRHPRPKAGRKRQVLPHS